MRRSLQASSTALPEKMEAMQVENEALHVEVTDLKTELRQQQARFEAEHRRLRTYVCELEQQLQSVVTSYEQVERQSESLSRENAGLRTTVSTVSAIAGGQSQGALAQEVAAAQSQVQQLERERGDLLDMLGRIVAACPGAGGFVAPLATTLAN